MEKASREHSVAAATDIRPQYRFDYRTSKPNRFAGRMPKNAVGVVLEPEVTSVFNSSDSANSFLRSVIKAMPARGKAGRKAG
jgi:hypothetical protein